MTTHNENIRNSDTTGDCDAFDAQYATDMKRYAEDVAKWLMMSENGQLDPEMEFPRLPIRQLNF